MKKWYVIIILALAQFIMVLDGTVMNVSIAKLVTDLNTSVSGIQMAITFFTLVMAAFMITGGKVGEVIGSFKAFKIGIIIFGVGALITALSPSLLPLILGWSVTEGIGAILVIPAIAALIVTNYKGKDRALAYGILGGVAGAGAAVGPLIGGIFTTYLSWRYVFFAEAIMVVILLFFTKHIVADKVETKEKIDIQSVFLSVTGLFLLVYGILQSKIWGWVTPLEKPVIMGQPIAPLGISVVVYLIVFGLIVLYFFVQRQLKLKRLKGNPLLDVSLFMNKQLRTGAIILLMQNFMIAGLFFVLPIYLQLFLNLDPLSTGLKIMPMSIALVVFAVLGAILSSKFSPRRIVQFGLVCLLIGFVVMIQAISVEMNRLDFTLGMILIGTGLGLLSSQLGNVILSSVSEKDSNQAGGIQGTLQNFGSSLGTALIGSVLIAALSSGFTTNIAKSSAAIDTNKYIKAQNIKSIPIVSLKDLSSFLETKKVPEAEKNDIISSYSTAELESLRMSLFAIGIVILLAFPLTVNIPNKSLSALKK